MYGCMFDRRMKMLASTKVRPVQFVLTLTVCVSLVVVSDGGLAAAQRRIHCVDHHPSPSDSAAATCQPTTKGVVPVSCEVCDHVPDHLVADCCRWCFAEKTYLQRDAEREIGAPINARKRGKLFLGKRPTYFLGKWAIHSHQFYFVGNKCNQNVRWFISYDAAICRMLWSVTYHKVWTRRTCYYVKIRETLSYDHKLASLKFPINYTASGLIILVWIFRRPSVSEKWQWPVVMCKFL